MVQYTSINRKLKFSISIMAISDSYYAKFYISLSYIFCLSHSNGGAELTDIIQVSHACQLLEERPRGTSLHKGINIRQLVDFYPTSMALLRGTNVKYLELQWKKLDSLLSEAGGSENIFLNLFGDHNLDNTFWLDSSSIDKVLYSYS